MPFGNPAPPTPATETSDLDGGNPLSSFEEVDGGTASTTDIDSVYDGGTP